MGLSRVASSSGTPKSASSPSNTSSSLRVSPRRRPSRSRTHGWLYEDRARTAQTLQQALLPSQLPQLADVQIATSYRAAGEGVAIDGDFYDVFELGDGSWAVVVGDVSGKGAPAAATTALARYTLRAHASDQCDPVRMLQLLNDALIRQKSPGFCTVALARVQPSADRMKIELVSAGHPPGIILRGGATYDLLGQVGTPLGVIEHPELVLTSAELDHEDSLVIYTDGLSDAAAPARFLGEDEIAAVAHRAVADGVTAVVEQLERCAVELANGKPREVESDGAGFELPSRPIPTPEGPGGWGLYLVDQRAERWRLDTVDGTRVWAEFAVS